MKNKLLESIIKERSFKNEKSVAINRLLIVLIASSFDLISYFEFYSVTHIKPTALTLISDLSFISFSSVVLFLLLKNYYNNLFKYIIISFDFLIASFSILYDPTIPKEGQIVVWSALTASLFLFYLNLLRYSKTGTLYSAALSFLLFSCIAYSSAPKDMDIIPMFLGLSIMLYIGYSLTASNLTMMEEANTKLMMERYLSPQLVTELYKNNSSIEPGGKIQKVTILFSDIRSFTTISEKLSPDDVVQFLNEYLSLMTDKIFLNNGTIDKFIGDAIMTIFGAPIQGEDDSLRAIITAFQMQEALEELNHKKKLTSIPMEMGIGIHTGDVLAGNIGSSKRLDYTIIGDNVNLCSRLESLTKIYPCKIIISEYTFLEIEKICLENNFVTREVDTVLVKGKTKQIKVYEVIAFKNQTEKENLLELKSKFEAALTLYKNKNFPSAIIEFEKIITDRLALFYIERCEKFIKNPPDLDWNGVYKFDVK
jgi:adenylate cyclase